MDRRADRRRAVQRAPAVLTEAFGTPDGHRVAVVERAFFDLHLQGNDRHLFDGRSKRFPEVTLVP